MKTVFEVEWMRLFKAITKYMSLAISIPIAVMLVIRAISLNFDWARVFEHVSAFGTAVFFLAIPLIAAVFAFPIAYWMKLLRITLSETEIHGRSFWGRRKTIPLCEIRGLQPFSQNGITYLIVDGAHHGKIYVSDHTEHFAELSQLLATYLPRPSEHEDDWRKKSH